MQRASRRTSSAAGDIVRAVIDLVAETIDDADGVCARAGLDRAELSQEGMRVPELTVIHLWTAIELATNDPCIGLHIAERGASSGAWGLLAYAVKSCSSVGDAWMRVRRYLPLVFTGADEIVDEVDAAGQRTIGYRRLPGGNPIVPSSEDCAVASFVIACRTAVGPAFRPTRALLQRAAPKDDSEHRRVMGCPVVFDASLNGLVLEAAVVDAPLRTSDPHLLALLEEMAERRLAAVGDAATLDELVARWVERRLEAGDSVTIGEAAQTFHTSVRSLQRELAAAKRPFKTLADDARRNIALRRIAGTAKSAKEVAAEIGFSDTTQFYRAFQRWTGQSVAEFRQRSARDDEPAT